MKNWIRSWRSEWGIEDISFSEVEIVVPLPHVERLGSDSHESHDKGMGVQRMETVDTDRESAVYPIAAICDDNKDELVAEEETDIDSMPLSIPMHVLQPEMKQDAGKRLWNQVNEQVMNIDLDYLIVNSERKLEGIGIPLHIKGREGVGVVFPDYMVCYVLCPQAKKLKEVESLPTARKNASMRELAVILTISAYYCVSLSWLLVWDSKPKVTIKLMNVVIANLFFNVALSRSSVITSLHDPQAAAKLSFFEEGMPSHHLHPTLRRLAGDSSLQILDFWLFNVFGLGVHLNCSLLSGAAMKKSP